MDAEAFSIIINTLVIATIVIMWGSLAQDLDCGHCLQKSLYSDERHFANH
jgi:hypothetical protein